MFFKTTLNITLSPRLVYFVFKTYQQPGALLSARGSHLLVISLTSATWWPADHAVGTEASMQTAYSGTQHVMLSK